METTKYQLPLPTGTKFFLVFYPDNGSREDCSVYYSWLTLAKNRDEAIKKVADDIDEEVDNLDAEKMDIIL